MRIIGAVLALALCTYIASASYCDKIPHQNTTVKRYLSERGKTKTISLYWGSDPARAASALLAVVLRHKLGYQKVVLKQGPHSLQDLAAKVPFEPNGKYNEVILAISTAWEPVHPSVWVPNHGATSGLAGPRLEEFGASTIPANQKLYVHLGKDFQDLLQCKNVVHWSFYTNVTTLKQCGFTNTTSSVGYSEQAIVYKLDSNDKMKIELTKRAKESKMHIEFEEISRQVLLQKIRTSNHSFLFIDYDIWFQSSKEVKTLQPPPCLSNGSLACSQRMDTSIAMRVADVFLLKEYAPDLFQFAHNFTPSINYIKEILELENDQKSIEEAACEWVSNHDAIVNNWVGKYDSSEKIYEIAVFYCADDPNHQDYDVILKLLGYTKLYSLYMSMFKINIRRYRADCSDSQYVKNKISFYMSDLIRQRLIGVVVGDMINITNVVKSIDGSNIPVLLYDAVGVDVDSTTSTWLTTGRSLDLAHAVKHFILDMKWTRIAVLSEPSLTAERFVEDLRTVGGFAIRNYPVSHNLQLSAAKAALQELKLDNARIILVNTNYKDAATILLAGAQLEMTAEKDFAWIVRDWRSNRTTSNMTHFTISFWCRSSEDVMEIDGWKDVRYKMDEYWRRPDKVMWPAHTAALADAVLTLANGFNEVFRQHSELRDDVHSKLAIRQFGKSLVEVPTKGVTQNLKFKGHSLEETVVFLDQWHGNKREHIARLRVNASSGAVQVDRQRRATYLQAEPPHDGALDCLMYYGDPYLPDCYDGLWATGLLMLVLAPPSFMIIYHVMRRRLKEHEKKIICAILAQRQQRAAALSASYLVDRSALELRHEIGAGRFGQVTLAVLRISGQAPRYVAAKALREHQDESEILREACTLASLDHEHIIRLVGVCIDKEPPLVLMEVAFFGDLLQYLQARRYLAEGATSIIADLNNSAEEGNHVSAVALTQLARQAASALAYLSQRGVIHRDLRASNCLVDANRSLKLADFGMARDISVSGSTGDTEYACRRRGLFPVLWMAPESLDHGLFSTASDVWALGVLVFELVTLGARPYGDMSPLRVMQFVATGGKPSMPRYASPQTIGLVRQCWQFKPGQRPTAADVVAYLAERPSALSPALECDDQPADADSGYGDSPMSELLP